MFVQRYEERAIREATREEFMPDDLIGREGNRQTERTILKTAALTGTANQIEWAEQIKGRVGNEFDRVANAMRLVAAKQGDLDRTDTLGLIAILDEKRLEVMANDRAGTSYMIGGS
jgi:hypothetical protein